MHGFPDVHDRRNCGRMATLRRVNPAPRRPFSDSLLLFRRFTRNKAVGIGISAIAGGRTRLDLHPDGRISRRASVFAVLTTVPPGEPPGACRVRVLVGGRSRKFANTRPILNRDDLGLRGGVCRQGPVIFSLSGITCALTAKRGDRATPLCWSPAGVVRSRDRECLTAAPRGRNGLRGAARQSSGISRYFKALHRPLPVRGSGCATVPPGRRISAESVRRVESCRRRGPTGAHLSHYEWHLSFPGRRGWRGRSGRGRAVRIARAGGLRRAAR
jgi:hypothetical protein